MVMIIPLLVFIAITGLFSVFSLTIGHFNAFYSLGAGIVTTTIYIVKTDYFRKIKAFRCTKLEVIIFILIIIFAIILRLPPSQYIMGGQDQGTYVNIAHQYVKQGSLKYKDYFRETLKESQKVLYDSNMNNLMPSFEYFDRDNSILEMVFYPMHPSWIAIFEVLFGQNNSTFALTFFSLISLILIYLLAYEISGKNKVAGFIALVLAVINPMHVFYSKFPVGEITAFTYIAAGIYLFMRAADSDNVTRQNIFEFFLSFALINGFLYTRMSFFIYLPVLVFIGIISALYINNINNRRLVLTYLGSLTIAFLLSFIFYYKNLPITFNRIYAPTIQKLLGNASDTKLLLIIILAGILIALLNIFRNTDVLLKIKKILNNYLWIIIALIIFLIAVFSIKQYLSIDIKDIPLDQNAERYWFTGKSDVYALKHTNLFIATQHTSLVGVLAIFIGSILYCFKKEKNVKIIILIFFVLYFLLIQSTYGDIVRYQYYTGRYIFLEIINFSLIALGVLSSLALKTKYKHVLYVIILPIIVYNLIFSIVQFLGNEGQNSNFYNDIRGHVKSTDLLILLREQIDTKPQKYFNNFATFSLAPFKFYYDMNVFSVDSTELLFGNDINNIKSQFRNTFVLSKSRIQSLKEMGVYTQRYSYYNTDDDCTLHTYSFLKEAKVEGINFLNDVDCFLPPHKYYTREMEFYLYQID